jgi:hypothetical protein
MSAACDAGVKTTTVASTTHTTAGIKDVTDFIAANLWYDWETKLMPVIEGSRSLVRRELHSVSLTNSGCFEIGEIPNALRGVTTTQRFRF